MFQIKNPDALHSIANWIRFFCVCMTVTAMMGIDEKVCFISMYQNIQKGDHFCALIELEMLSTAFDKICIKIEKCRTKAADLRQTLFDI